MKLLKVSNSKKCGWKQNTVSLDADGGVEVLSEKTRYDDNFQKNSVDPESIPVNDTLLA